MAVWCWWPLGCLTGLSAGEPLLAAELAGPTELKDEVSIADLTGLSSPPD